MTKRMETSTVVSDAVKDLLRRQLKSGWTAERVAYEMQRIGHKGWNAKTPSYLLNHVDARPLTVDEAVGIVAVFGGRLRAVTRELERLTAMVAGEKAIA